MCSSDLNIPRLPPYNEPVKGFGYGICIKYKDAIHDLDMSLTPVRGWNNSANCGLWNCIMLIYILELYDNLPQILDIFSYRYPIGEYNFYKNIEVRTVGDVFMIELLQTIPPGIRYLSTDDIKTFIQMIKRMTLRFIAKVPEIDYHDIKKKVYTKKELNSMDKPSLILICKVRMFSGCVSLNKADLIYNILQSQVK